MLEPDIRDKATEIVKLGNGMDKRRFIIAMAIAAGASISYEFLPEHHEEMATLFDAKLRELIELHKQSLAEQGRGYGPN